MVWQSLAAMVMGWLFRQPSNSASASFGPLHQLGCCFMRWTTCCRRSHAAHCPSCWGLFHGFSCSLPVLPRSKMPLDRHCLHGFSVGKPLCWNMFTYLNLTSFAFTFSTQFGPKGSMCRTHSQPSLLVGFWNAFSTPRDMRHCLRISLPTLPLDKKCLDSLAYMESPKWSCCFSNDPRPSPEPPEPSPEPRWTWPGACTSAHRSYSGLKTLWAYTGHFFGHLERSLSAQKFLRFQGVLDHAKT